jgi:hypothetical protein
MEAELGWIRWQQQGWHTHTPSLQNLLWATLSLQHLLQPSRWNDGGWFMLNLMTTARITHTHTHTHTQSSTSSASNTQSAASSATKQVKQRRLICVESDDNSEDYTHTHTSTWN